MGHVSCWEIERLIRDDDAPLRSLRASERLLSIAAGLESTQLSLVFDGDGAGRIQIRLHSDARSALDRDLPWVGEDVAHWRRADHGLEMSSPADMRTLVELRPAVQVRLPEPVSLHDPFTDDVVATPPDLWPVGFVGDGLELLTALTTVQAQVRIHIAPANDLERQMISQLTRRWASTRDPLEYSQYMGTPVRIRCFVGQTGGHLSPRLRAALSKLGAGLLLVPCDPASPAVMEAWNGEPATLAGAVQPFGVGMCFVHLPASGPEAELCGVPTAEAETRPVPLDAPLTSAGLRIGRALASDGRPRDIHLAREDVVLHTQVLGAPGMGKSTLLAAMVKEACLQGVGVSVIDPHGHLVDRILREADEGMIDRTVVVRSADDASPVPVNVLNNTDPDLVSEVMVQVLRELLDPSNQGFLGPRFERIFSQTTAALRELFGRRANFAALPLMLRDRLQVGELVAALRSRNRDLAREIDSELAHLRDDEFSDVSAWVNSKYQRLIASHEARAILSTGEDAVDVASVMDSHQLLLIDLASTAVGPLGAQFLGEMWLIKHWAALSQRSDITVPHLLIVDEAHLFASGLLPRLLAEARKFGLGVVLAHQHLEQLTPHLREAALATTSNVIVFRSGPREAGAAALRLGGWAGGPLTRLPRFQAAVTLSQGDQQTDAFSLIVDHNERIPAGEQSFAERITEASNTRFVEPYRHCVPITAGVLDARVAELQGAESADPPHRSPLLDEWLAVRRKTQAGQSGTEGDFGDDDSEAAQ